MPEFVDAAMKDIDERLRELHDEVSRLEAARAALTGQRRRPGRPRGTTTRAKRPATSPRTTRSRATRTRATRARPARRTAPKPRTRTNRRGGNTRAAQAMALVGQRPGITIPQIADAMRIQPNYLYRVLPRLESEGQVKRDGQGWHPAK